MADEVKTRRYDNSQRTNAARQTRRAVVAAAYDLFVANGYPGTTLAAIAERAGVSVQTVYAQFGNKSTVLKEVVDQSVAGDDEPTPINQREWVRDILAEPDPRAKLARQAGEVARIMHRSYRLDAVLRSAAPLDADAEALWHKGSRQRHAGMKELAGHLRETGHLRPDLTVDQAADRVAALITPELYRLTVEERRWTTEAYETWLAELLVASLLVL